MPRLKLRKQQKPLAAKENEDKTESAEAPSENSQSDAQSNKKARVANAVAKAKAKKLAAQQKEDSEPTDELTPVSEEPQQDTQVAEQSN